MIQILVDRPPGIVFSWALLSSLGEVRDRKLSLDPALKQNNALWLTLPWKFTGCVTFSLILGSLSKLTFLHCDNKSAIAIASNPFFHSHTKHNDVDFHITRQAYEKKIVSLPY